MSLATIEELANTMTSLPDDRILTISELAKATGKSYWQTRRLLQTGKFPVVKVGNVSYIRMGDFRKTFGQC